MAGHLCEIAVDFFEVGVEPVPPIDSTCSAADGGFAAEVGSGQQIAIDSCYCRASAGPSKFYSDCEKVQHTC